MSFRDRFRRFRTEVKESLKSPGASASPVTLTTPLPHTPITSMRANSQSSWGCLGSFQSALRAISGGFGPLKLVIDDLAEFITIYEDDMKARRDYATLKNELEELFSALGAQLSGNLPPTMTAGMHNLCAAINTELENISSKKDGGRGRRYLEASKDLDDLMECYRRIQNHLERLRLNADLSMWKLVDEFAAENRLKSLAPSLSARYDSAEALTVGRRECTPETRKQVLSDLSRWRHDKTRGNMYWLNGMAGTGKTTIASSLCAMLDQFHELGGSFFCSRVLPECRNAKLILPTIAYQLARYSRPFYHALSLALQNDPDLHTKLLPKQFNGLIVEPLLKVAHALPADIVIVIDALDECDDTQEVGLLLEILAKSALGLPIKIFVSSRPELHIRQKLCGTTSRLILHELEDSIVKEDIKLYLQTELMELLTSVSDAELAALVAHAGMLFIYAATVVRYIRIGASDIHRRQRMKLVLATTDSVPSNKDKDIDMLYTTILASAFDKPDLEVHEKRLMRLVLNTVVCAQEPLTIGALTGLLGLEHSSLVQAALEPLWSVLHISGSDDIVTTLHASFPDYMLALARSKEYGCQAGEHHSQLAELCFNRIKSNRSQFNICGLESSFVQDNEVRDLEERIILAIPQDLLYACRYWTVHLAQGEPLAKHLEQLEQLLSQRLLLWMEVLNLKKIINVGPVMLARARMWCQQVGAPQGVQNLVHDAWRFSITFATGDVSRSTPHLYVSLLASWPSPGPISDYYMHRTRGLCRLEGTAKSRRQIALLSAIKLGRTALFVAFSPDSNHIVSSFEDGTISILDAASGKPAMDLLNRHTDSVSSVAFSPDGGRIVSGSHDCTIRLWDATTGAPIMEPLVGHTNSVNSVAFSSDGTSIVSGSDDMTVCLWDAITGKLKMNPFRGHAGDVWSVAFSPDSMHVVSGSVDETVCVWDITSGKLVMDPLKGHSSEVSSVAFSPDGMRIASGSYDKTICVWDATSGQLTMSPLTGHTWSVKSVVFSSDGLRIITCSEDQTIRVWDTMSGEPVMSALQGHGSWFLSVACSPDGTRIVSSSHDAKIHIWDAASGKLGTDSVEGHTDSVNSVAFSPDGTRIASGSWDSTARVWDATSGKLAMDPLKGHTSMISSVAFSPDCTLLATGSYDYTIRLWDAMTGKLTIEPLQGHTNSIHSIAFSPDSTCIASGSYDCTIRIWNTITGKQTVEPLKGHTNSVGSVAFSPDGLRIASGSRDKTIRVWDVTSGLPVMEPLLGHHHFVRSVSFSPDGTHIVSASADNTICLWNATNGEPEIGPLGAHTNSVDSVTFSPDGKRIASGSSDKTIHIWDITNGQPVAYRLEGHTEAVMSVAFSPDGMRLASGSTDSVIRMWDTRAHFSAATAIEHHEPSSQAQNHSWTLDERGWVLDEQNRPFLWLPADLRHCLLRPRNIYLISLEGSVELDIGGAYLGESWTKCYTHT